MSNYDNTNKNQLCVLKILNINMGERKKITADLILDLYLEAKCARGVKKEEIMKRVIFLSQHLNERLDLVKIGIK